MLYIRSGLRLLLSPIQYAGFPVSRTTPCADALSKTLYFCKSFNMMALAPCSSHGRKRVMPACQHISQATERSSIHVLEIVLLSARS
jgi:hypothetical protein